MDYSKILESYRRFRSNSALTDSSRNLLDDYVTIERWLYENIDTSTSYGEYIRLCLIGDAQYMTVNAAVRRNVRFKELAPIGSWNGLTVKDTCRLMDTIVNASLSGDAYAWKVQSSRLYDVLLYELKDSPAMKLYLIQAWLDKDSTARKLYTGWKKVTDSLLACKTDEEVEATLSRQFEKPDKKKATLDPDGEPVEELDGDTRYRIMVVRNQLHNLQVDKDSEDLKELAEDVARNINSLLHGRSTSKELYDYVRTVDESLTGSSEKVMFVKRLLYELSGAITLDNPS